MQQTAPVANSRRKSKRSSRTPPRPAALSRLPAWSRPLASRTAWMQRIQDRVRVGYVRWVGGEIEPDRWPALATKLNGMYRVDSTTKKRSRDRKKGIGAAMLLAYFDGRAGVVRWILQVSDGIHPSHVTERLKDATSKDGRLMLEVLGYELVQLDSSWTWRMTSKHRKLWQVRIRKAAADQDAAQAGMLARQIIFSLSRVPGFRGVRRDAFELRGLLLKEWRRLRDRQDMNLLPPRPWPRIGYARRLKSH